MVRVRVDGQDRVSLRVENAQARHLVQAITLTAKKLGARTDADVVDIIIASLRHEYQSHIPPSQGGHANGYDKEDERED